MLKALGQPLKTSIGTTIFFDQRNQQNKRISAQRYQFAASKCSSTQFCWIANPSLISNHHYNYFTNKTFKYCCSIIIKFCSCPLFLLVSSTEESDLNFWANFVTRKFVGFKVLFVWISKIWSFQFENLALVARSWETREGVEGVL